MKQTLFSVLLAFALAGCAATSGGRGGRVDEVHLFGLPVTVNMDGKPGPDGFAIRVFVTQRNQSKGSPLNNGDLEIMMFDGVLSAAEVLEQTPLQSWKFTSRQISPNREITSLGTGYRFALRWDTAPKRGYITVVARCIPPAGDPVYSSPSTIAAPVDTKKK
jgi:hypothetical protein